VRGRTGTIIDASRYSDGMTEGRNGGRYDICCVSLPAVFHVRFAVSEAPTLRAHHTTHMFNLIDLPAYAGGTPALANSCRSLSARLISIGSSIRRPAHHNSSGEDPAHRSTGRGGIAPDPRPVTSCAVRRRVVVNHEIAPHAPMVRRRQRGRSGSAYRIRQHGIVCAGKAATR